MFSFPEQLLIHTGPIYSIEQPAQGNVFEVFFIAAERGRFVLKRSQDPYKIDELKAEAQVLSHLRFWQPLVAQPVAQVVDHGMGLFLFTYLEGISLCDAVQRGDKAQQHAMIAAYAQKLRSLHSWKPDLPVPEDWLTTSLQQALVNVSAGLEPDGFLEHSFLRHSGLAGQEAEHIASRLSKWRGELQNDLVFGHGDYCLPNVLMEGNSVTGVIDWSRGGYQDRRFDLAMAALSIRHNLADEQFVHTFLTVYGYSEAAESLHFFEALYVLL